MPLEVLQELLVRQDPAVRMLLQAAQQLHHHFAGAKLRTGPQCFSWRVPGFALEPPRIDTRARQRTRGPALHSGPRSPEAAAENEQLWSAWATMEAEEAPRPPTAPRALTARVEALRRAKKIAESHAAPDMTPSPPGSSRPASRPGRSLSHAARREESRPVTHHSGMPSALGKLPPSLTQPLWEKTGRRQPGIPDYRTKQNMHKQD